MSNIFDYFYGQIDSMREELDKELKMDVSTTYISRNRRQNRTESLIEAALGYVVRLLHNQDEAKVTSYPSLSFLDHRKDQLRSVCRLSYI